MFPTPAERERSALIDRKYPAGLHLPYNLGNFEKMIEVVPLIPSSLKQEQALLHMEAAK
jgi:hypothetical protein